MKVKITFLNIDQKETTFIFFSEEEATKFFMGLNLKMLSVQFI